MLTPPIPPSAGPVRAEGPSGRVTGRLWAYVALLVAVLALTGLSQTPPGRWLLKSIGVLGSGSGYTELSFADPGGLPRRLAAKVTVSDLPFTIHNLTRQDRQYSWSVTMTSRGKTRRAATGATGLVNGARLTVTPRLRIECVPGPLRVTVQVSGSSTESIDFHATCTRGAAHGGQG
jgi:hypothetical protein